MEFHNMVTTTECRHVPPRTRTRAPAGNKNAFAGLLQTILGKGPWPKLGKKSDLTAKLGEINDIEHNQGSKIYHQNQVILDCIMPTLPLIHKCLSIILMWVIVHISSSGLYKK